MPDANDLVTLAIQSVPARRMRSIRKPLCMLVENSRIQRGGPQLNCQRPFRYPAASSPMPSVSFRLATEIKMLYKI